MRPCATPRCSNLVERGHCPLHRKQKEKDRGSSFERGYDKAWSAYSLSFREAYPLCGMRPNNLPPVMSQCYQAGRPTPVLGTTHGRPNGVVDHVVPHRGDQRLFHDPNNHQSLCWQCHSRKTQAGL